jgi:hypothetical protein
VVAGVKHPPPEQPIAAFVANLIHEREPLERHHAGDSAVRKEKVCYFNGAVFGFRHIWLDLRLEASATANEHSFKPVLGRDLQIDRENWKKP